mmetsp:Transcript_24800/g.77976  ORF Transcript_24800/g.77976 Transcript_24800/m.77976 type:complete len:317 (-) Transcript_24800:562-1512(-)
MPSTTSMLCGGAVAAAAVSPTNATSGIVHIPTGYRAASASSASGEQPPPPPDAASTVSASVTVSAPVMAWAGTAAPQLRRVAGTASCGWNMALMADSACARPVDASWGLPITSPAAYTPSAARRHASTMRSPFLASLAPAARSPTSSFTPPVFARRPVAVKTRSASNGRRPAALPVVECTTSTLRGSAGLRPPTAILGGATSQPEICESNRMRTPAAWSSPCSAKATAASMPTRRSELARSEARTTIVTRAPKAAKMRANSTAMIPPPTMTADRGRKASALIESESKQRICPATLCLYSSATASRRTALDPVATSA